MTEAEFHKLVYLRALEWANWPSFLSQLYLPLVLAFLPWQYVFGAQIFICLMWCSFRYDKPDFKSAMKAAEWVGRLKWPVAIVGCLRPLITGHIVIGGICLVWPLLSGFLFFGGKVGVIERGFFPEDQTKDGAADKSRPASN
jgi:hypothetical protein